MSENEYKITQEEKAMAFLRGVAIGATGACVTVLIILTLIHFGL
jgi:hypothetical protein